MSAKIVALTSPHSSFDSGAYSQDRSVAPGHTLLEKPAIFAALPSLKEKRVLCLGCGEGDECEQLMQRGASSVLGIDNSDGMIGRARARYPHLKFDIMDMDALPFTEASFDLVFSSLALHYMEDWHTLFIKIAAILVPAGYFIFSTHHPSSWGAEKYEDEKYKRQLLGYELEKTSGNLKFYGDYLTSRKIEGQLFGKHEVTYYHKSYQDIFQSIKASKLSLNELIEPKPIATAEAIEPQFWEIRKRFPLFSIFVLQKLSS